jgi:hypothetical protein
MKLLIVAGVLLLTACSSLPKYEGYANSDIPPPSSSAMRIYDVNGNFIGHIDEDEKRIYDRNGNYVGMIQ